MTVLVTGGAGYIGSHTVVELLNAGHAVVVIDNLSNGSALALLRVEQITGKAVNLIKGDIRDRAVLDRIFADHAIEAVIHFAGLKAVGESVSHPLDYYENNVFGTLVLCQAMVAAGVHHLVFSSSATVYGTEATAPYRETMPRGTTTSPYGTSKAMIEKIMEDLAEADERWSVVMLRYFNPIGAHPSGLIGEDPRGIPNNLMPYISRVAVGQLSELSIYGDDYPTPDGTCERDYLHVVDLAIGHLKALRALHTPGVKVYNLGAGTSVSVLKVVNSFVQATGVEVPYRFAARREGDLPAFWADTDKAERELGWRAERGLKEMMTDTWRWQKSNPNGFVGC